jgi:hypothetical protein
VEVERAEGRGCLTRKHEVGAACALLRLFSAEAVTIALFVPTAHCIFNLD